METVLEGRRSRNQSFYIGKDTYLLAVISPNSVCLSCAKRCASEPEVTYATSYNNLGALHR
jgi:hypothetical protein